MDYEYPRSPPSASAGRTTAPGGESRLLYSTELHYSVILNSFMIRLL